MDIAIAEAVWTRLRAGKPLDALGLPELDGRIDLRGLRASEPVARRRFKMAGATLGELTNTIALRGVSWAHLDFCGAVLPSLRFFDCEIEDCRFDEADCRDWRVWGTRVERCSFVRADLRDAALGGVEDGKRNVFRRVDFRDARLKGSAHVSAHLTECRFSNLAGVDFQGDVFVDCVFEGELRDVLFYKRAFRGERYPANDMKGGDFRDATLRHVGFRDLDLRSIRWPRSPDHVIVADYPATLERMLAAVQKRRDGQSRKMERLLAHMRKWAGADQHEGVVNKRDLEDIGGPEFVDEFLRLARVE